MDGVRVGHGSEWPDMTRYIPKIRAPATMRLKIYLVAQYNPDFWKFARLAQNIVVS